MKPRLIACSLLALTLAGCGRSSDGTAPGNVAGSGNTASSEANTIEETGAPGGVGSYGPGLVATPVFVAQTAMGDRFEIEASKLALAMSHSGAVRTYARDMIAAHQATTAALEKIAAAENISAKLPPALDPRHQRMLDDLRKARPDAFDKLYLDQQQTAHREALGLMISYAAHGDNAALKAFAGRTKSRIQDHLDMAATLDHGGADEAHKAS